MKQIDRLTRDQAIGAYIGMAVGDAYGAPFEFMHGDEVRSFFADVGDKIGYFSGGAHNVIEGEWTDDTAMARCITDSYQLHGEICPHQIMENFYQWMNTGEFGTRTECFDIGGTCARAIHEWKMPKITATPEVIERRQGNGGIMRLGPVICFNSQNYFEAVNDAIYTSHLTHANDVCDLYAEAVVDRCFGTGLFPDDHAVNAIEGSGHVAHTYWNASFAYTTSATFMDCMRACVMMGGDTDTTAAVAGMIWGARNGLSSIPEKMVDDLFDSSILMAEAEYLYQMGKAPAL